ncbi:MAG: DUF4118 domain-containing protein [Firmicutes bacterium]|nr:DUF4118 domain-containing protein [Bacillota bacterium]MDD7601276.1 DUF4118 domain-containing protein [Bacillota bacterium]MDY5856456.1 DUF4118 domain-containing protein [Anaerovoracaceae bacterium]
MKILKEMKMSQIPGEKKEIYKKYLSESATRESMQKDHQRNCIIFLGIFLLATGSSFVFNQIASDPSLNIAMIYVMGLFMVARYTDGYVFGLLFAVCSVISVNYFFTVPYRNLNFTMEGYQVTFAGMLIIAMITSAMTTHMKEQAAALAEQEKQLMEAQKEKMRANLLRAVSHDLRTPLTGIIGNSSSYLEMEDELSAEEKRALVSHIQEDANWLLNMVENLLSVTRIDNETAQVNKSYEAVDEVVASSVVRFRKRFPDAQVEVRVPDDVVMVMMDVMLIEQVLINILQNAQLHAHTQKPIRLYVEEDENDVWFHVRDFGDGIDESRLSTIFDGEGYRDTVKESDSYKGMGIGLSICKTIVTAHGGTIGAINHEEGAEFYFSLPKEMEE